MKYRAIHVEDDTMIRTMVPLLLAMQRIHVTSYEDFTTSYDAITGFEGPLDLFITDINLPDGHGYKLVPEIRQRKPGVPVIVFSGEDKDLASARDALKGLDNVLFVKKPDVAGLVSAVKSSLSS
jgi:two-component system nitrogen regulation response regulator GlnG